MRILVFTRSQNPLTDYTDSRVGKDRARVLVETKKTHVRVFSGEKWVAIWANTDVPEVRAHHKLNREFIAATRIYPEMTLIPETPANRYPRILHQKRDHTYGFERHS